MIFTMSVPVKLPLFTLEIDFDYNPGDPGQTSGPPERCYPPEDDEFVLNSVHLIEGKDKRDVTSLIVSELCEGTMETIEAACMEYYAKYGQDERDEYEEIDRADRRY